MNIAQVLVTTALTIFSGLLLLLVGELATKFFVTPVQELRGVIGNVAYGLDFYANKMFSASYEKSAEARELYRRQACRIRECLRQIPCYRIAEVLGLLPPLRDVEEASRLLIGLANYPAEPENRYYKAPDDEIAKLLRIKML